MKVLMLGTDRDVLREGSRSYKRITSYGELCDELHIVVTGGNGETLRALSNVYIHATSARTKIGMFAQMIHTAIRIAREHEFQSGSDLVTSQDPFEVGCVAYVVSRIRGLALHLQVHIDFFSPYYKRESLRQRFQALCAEFLLPHADGIRVVSEKIRTYLIGRGVPTDRITCLPIHTDWRTIAEAPQRIDVRKNYPNAFPLILSASRLVPQKNIFMSIDAFSRLVTTHSDAHLLIVGKGKEERALRRYVADKDLNEHVSFEAWTDDMPSYLKAADIFVLSSDYEGWGLSVVEACAAGTPVVMTDVGCAGEFLIDGVNGIVVPVRDVDALSETLGDLAGSEDKRRMFGVAAQNSVQSLPTWHEYLSSMRNSWECSIRTI